MVQPAARPRLRALQHRPRHRSDRHRLRPGQRAAAALHPQRCDTTTRTEPVGWEIKGRGRDFCFHFCLIRRPPGCFLCHFKGCMCLKFKNILTFKTPRRKKSKQMGARKKVHVSKYLSSRLLKPLSCSCFDIWGLLMQLSVINHSDML